MDFPLYLILQLLMLLIWVEGSDSSHRIKHKNNETAVLGEDVTIFFNLTTPADVVQITWQKIQDSLPQNIGTYSDKYGEKILPPYVDRLHCKIIKPNISFLTIREVAFEDEACYKCLFNVFPHGSQGGQICLTILILMKPPEEYLVQNPNSTVTVTKTYTISLETVKSLGLHHLIVHVDHPLRNEDKIVPLYVNEECTSGSFSVWIPVVCALLTLCISFTIVIILYIKRKKQSKNMREPTPQLRQPHMETLMSYCLLTCRAKSSGTC
ncbi:PREDICTED: OX-2 membrane glycoprotein-like [Galeopterus variegatus]|uniref:OX-2 membrane glycoprotein-like n=1 Tax=Galeopterus variegatus TaxID=482537 RepID=A0ABM0QUF7_GALVR|nr:PREDICTED: OX-2 membrane glycoprotein-like [Galeopterus variegatus]